MEDSHEKNNSNHYGFCSKYIYVDRLRRKRRFTTLSLAKRRITLSSNDTFRQLLIDAAQETAKKMGAATFEIRDSEGSLEAQLSHIREAVEGNYDVILCNPVDADTTLQLQIEAGDIPMVFYGNGREFNS